MYCMPFYSTMIQNFQLECWSLLRLIRIRVINWRGNKHTCRTSNLNNTVLYQLDLRSQAFILLLEVELKRISLVGWNWTSETTPEKSLKLWVQYCFSQSQTLIIPSLDPTKKKECSQYSLVKNIVAITCLIKINAQKFS